MSKWEEKKLKDIGNIITGNTPTTSNKEMYGEKYKFIKGTDITEGVRTVESTEEMLSEVAFNRYKKSIIPPNTTCVVTIGTLGKKMCLSNEHCFTNQAINAIVQNEGYDGRFIYYNMKLLLPFVKFLSSGTASGRENVSKSSFSNIKIRVPDFTTQEKIADILSTYDDLIENNNRRIQLLEKSAQDLYKEWFVRFRFPNYENTKFINGLPEGWEVKRLGDVANVKAGGDRPNSFSDTKNDFYNIPIYSNGITNEGLYGYTDKAIVFDESVTISARGTIGYVSLKVQPYVPIVRLLSVIPLENIINSKYLYFYLKNSFIEGNGTSQQQLTVPDFKKRKIIIPISNIVKDFKTFCDTIFCEIEVLKTQTQNLKKQRDLLLPRLMSGKLEV